MAKHQTRRSISVSKATYLKLREFAESYGGAMSALTERAIDEMIKFSAEIRIPKKAEPRRFRRRPHHDECKSPLEDDHSVCPL